MAVPLAGRANTGWSQNRWLAIQILAGTQNNDLSLTGVVAPQFGLWQPTGGLWPLAVTLGGEFTALTAELRVCNLPRRPQDTDNSWPSIYRFTQKDVLTVNQPFVWVKLQVTDIAVDDGTLGMFASFAAGQGG